MIRYGIKNFMGLRTTAKELFEQGKEFCSGQLNIEEFLKAFEEKSEFRFCQEGEDLIEICKVIITFNYFYTHLLITLLPGC